MEKKTIILPKDFKDYDMIEIIPEGFEIEIKDNKIYAVKKLKIYPKTEKECDKVLNLNKEYERKEYKYDVMSDLRSLIKCYDAYMQAAGNWTIDKAADDDFIYLLICMDNKICKHSCRKIELLEHRMLMFPSEEAMDQFAYNFRFLLERCKKYI